MSFKKIMEMKLESERVAREKDLKILKKLVWKENSYFFHVFKKNKKIFYREFQIPKRDLSMRSINAPTPLLRFLQKSLCYSDLFNELNQFISKESFAYKKNISCKDMALIHLKNDELLKLDIENFFQSISIKDIKMSLQRLGVNSHTANIISEISSYKNHLPQGAPTSPFLSNIFFIPIDKRLRSLAKYFDLTYTRYADDLYFSGTSINNDIIDSIKSILSEYNLLINRKKLSIKRKGQRKIVTGIDISNGILRTPKPFRKKFKYECYELLKNIQKNDVSHEYIKSNMRKLQGKANYILNIEGTEKSQSTLKIFYYLTMLSKKELPN